MTVPGAGNPSLAPSGAHAQQSQSQWSALKEAAGAGQLYFEPKAAEQCAQACEAAIGEIDEQLARSRDLFRVDGFGHTSAGMQLASKFSGKAEEAVRVLKAHQHALRDMRDTFRAAGRAFGESEDSNQGQFGSGG